MSGTDNSTDQPVEPDETEPYNVHGEMYKVWRNPLYARAVSEYVRPTVPFGEAFRLPDIEKSRDGVVLGISLETGEPFYLSEAEPRLADPLMVGSSGDSYEWPNRQVDYESDDSEPTTGNWHNPHSPRSPL